MYPLVPIWMLLYAELASQFGCPFHFHGSNSAEDSTFCIHKCVCVGVCINIALK